MPFLSTSSVRDLDARIIEQGTPGTVLMGRASRGLADELQFLSDHRPQSALVVAGPGNNGGDGFGLAMHLHAAGWRVDVRTTVTRDRYDGDARQFLEKAERNGVRIQFCPTEDAWEEDPDLPRVDWVVDALLGTGTREAPGGVPAAAVRFIRQQGVHGRVVAVDLPSGLNADTGDPYDPDLCVQADFTLTLAAAKTGFANPHAGTWTGSISVVDLRFPPDQIQAAASGDWRVPTATQVREVLNRRSYDGHKGTHGHVLVVGGSPGMTGAVGLAALAALRGGAGLVTVLTPSSCAAALDAGFPEIMVIGGAEGRDRTLTADAWTALLPDMNRYDAILLGPGMRVNADTEVLTRKILFDCEKPLVLDADALNVVTGRTQWLYRARMPLVLTPHPGELARLLGLTVDTVQSDRAGMAERAARECDATVVLKGAGTRIADPEQVRWMNLNGNPGLGTGGSGDVLAGLVASLLGQGMSLDHAVPAAVYLHGRAGDLASMRQGQRGMIARDLVDALASTLVDIAGR